MMPAAWQQPGLAQLLEEVVATLDRWVVFPTEAARDTTALWVVHSHCADASFTTPRLAFLSPEPGSGKSRCLDVLQLLCRNPLVSTNTTVSALVHSAHSGNVTILLDEVDAIFGSRSTDKAALRGLLNSGFQRGGTYQRMIGGRPVALQTFSPTALAGLGELPHTVATRAIVIRMHRRAASEVVEPFRVGSASVETAQLRVALAEWADSEIESLLGLEAELPDGIADRAADVWQPLLVIASAAGGDWLQRAQTACTELTRGERPDDASTGLRLLTDLRDIFGATTKMATEEVLSRLAGLPESPWTKTTPRQLAELLRPYGVGSLKIKLGLRSAQGYRAEHFTELWARYCPDEVPEVPPVPVEIAGS